MSSLPIRGSQNTSSTAEWSIPTVPVSDHHTDDQEIPIDNNSRFSSPSSPSNLSQDHDHAPENDSDHSIPLDNAPECSGNEHMDRSPTSPIVSTPGLSGNSSDDHADADTHANTTEDNPESPLNSALFLPLPTSSPGCLTHAHQQAMANRITFDNVLRNGRFDPARYTPVFLHDTLMLPGSLATVVGKESPLDILERLTPARLPSFTILAHHTSPQTACLLPSSSQASSPVATGLLLLGTGRDSRKAIKAHYRPVAKRQHHKVVIEVRVPIARSQLLAEDVGVDDGEGLKWRLEARWVEAQVFVWKGAVEGDERGWELGEAIWGSHGDDDGEIDVGEMGDDEQSEVGSEVEAGNLMLDGRSEWAQPVVFGDGKEIDADAMEW